MATEPISSVRNGTKLVVGLLLFAVTIAVGLRFYLSSLEEDSSVLQQRGIPAARVGIGLSQEGRKLLSQDEQQELDSLYGETLQTLRQEEKQRFYTLSQKGANATDQEITESWELMQKALETLPQVKRDRLFAIIGKAVQLAQKKSPAEEKPDGQ
jgi:hypothetical protein